MDGNLDAEEIRAIAMLANEGYLREKERSEAAKQLMEDGLSISDIRELAPNLLKPVPPRSAETVSEQPPNAKRVLVADDEHSVTLTIRNILESEGYLVKTASDGHEVLRALSTFRPHALILDVVMPREDGDHLSRKIKMRLGGVGTKPPKIMLITGKYLDQDPNWKETMIRFSLADAMLYKPFSAKDLVPMLQSLIA